VAPCLFCFIKRTIRAFIEIGKHIVEFHFRNAEARGENNCPVSSGNMDIAADKPCLLRESPCRLDRVPWQDDRKFLTADASRNSVFTVRRLAQFGGESSNNTISQRVAVRVVDRLEMIDIAKAERQGLPHALRFFNRGFGSKLEATPVEQPR